MRTLHTSLTKLLFHSVPGWGGDGENKKGFFLAEDRAIVGKSTFLLQDIIECPF